MRILGIDPGTATTGFGVIERQGSKLVYADAGVILTPAGQPMPERLLTIYQELTQIIKESSPDIVAVEQLFFASNVTTAISVGQARGIVLLAAAEAGLPVTEFTPLQVKQGICGYGKATKKQVQEMVKTLLGLSAIPKPDDAADALAIAITSAHSIRVEPARA